MRTPRNSLHPWTIACRALTSASALLLLARLASAQLVRQDFESWPDTGNTWATYTNTNWIIADAQVRPTTGGHGSTLGTHSAWLDDHESTTNAFVRAPLMPHGASAISFQARRADGNIGDQFFEVQLSTDSTNWSTAQTFDRVNETWTTYSAQLDRFDPVHVRIKKTGDFGDNQYLGIDEIEIIPAPGVRLSALANAPASPTVLDPVHLTLSAEPCPGTSNVVLTAYYRPGTAGVFSAITMTNTTGTTWQTTTPIPAGFPAVVQYYAHCAYAGFGLSPIFIPLAGSNSPAYFDTSKPYLNTALRQLTPSAHRTPLILSEIHYHPHVSTGTNSLEFLELFNTDPVEIDLTGYTLAGDIAYTFPTGLVLAARTHLVIARDPAALQAHYALPAVLGPFTGALPNEGGSVLLRNRENALLLEVAYADQPPWPIAADGAGHSLVLARPDYGEAAPGAWFASRTTGGSPNFADPVTNSPLDSIVINEVLAHTDLPAVDAIELFNTGTQTVDLTGCTLSDSPDTNKFTIPPGTTIGPRACLAFTQPQLGFSLSPAGDDVYLNAPALNRTLDAVRFPAQINGASIGRLPDGAPDFTSLAAPSLGAPNAPAGARPEAIVINEIMYHPLTGDGAEEYVELYNQSTAAVSVGSWRFTDGITFTIPPGTTIPALSTLVIARDAAALIARYPHLTAANTIGNFSGQLADGGEYLRLARPDDPALPNQDFVTVDDLTYRDGDDWGRWADGGGSSLELIDPRADNRLAMNWAGSDESAKAGWTTINVTAPMDGGAGPPDELRLYLLQAGECLVDNIRVQRPDGTVVYLNATFESGLGPWQPAGNHTRSSLATTGGFGGSARSLHLRASGPGMEGTWNDGNWNEAFWNRVSGPMTSIPPTGSNLTVQARVRWLAGWPHLVFSVRGYWMEAAARADVPNNLGTPGLPNSRARPNAPPAIDAPTHAPTLPATNQPAIVSCFLSDPDGIASATLHYRIDPATNLVAVTMLDSGTGPDAFAGDGRYSAAIPAQPAATLAAFTITAVDAAPAPQTNTFPSPGPPGSPAREALVVFGERQPPGVLGAYRLWLSATNIWRWQNLNAFDPTNNPSRYSNEPIDVTFVSGNDRAIYNAGARFRGLWRSYGSPVNSGAYAVDLPPSESFLGEDELAIDQPGQTGGDTQRQRENYGYWAARRIGLPAPQIRFIRLFVNGTDRGVQHDLQTPGNPFVESWFGETDPPIYKMYGWEGDPFTRLLDTNGNWKDALYRWHLRILRRDTPSDDFTPVHHVADAAAQSSNALYEARLSALLDLRTWIGYFAVDGAIANWDSYGWKVGHNGYLCIPHSGGARFFLYDLDYSMDQVQPLYPTTKFPHPDRLIGYPPFRRQYLAHFKEFANGPMSAPAVAALADPLYNAFLNSGAPGIAPPTNMKAWLANYRTLLLAQVAANDAPFTITSNGGANFATTNPIVTLTGTAPLGADSIRINGLRNRLSFTTTTNWSLRLGLPQGPNPLLLTAHNWRGDTLASNAITVTLTTPPPSPAGQLIISEIMYNPPIPEDEYVELYNRSTTHAFDLRGWRLNGADCTFDGGSIIGPRQFAIIARSPAAYQHTYGNAETIIGNAAGQLDNSGETLSLQQPAGPNAWTTINAVTYDNAPPWPAVANGHGASLQVVDLTRDNARPANWRATGNLPTPAWTFCTVTGTVALGPPPLLAQARVNLSLQSAGRLLVDRLALVTGLVAEAGSNLLANGSFESPLTGPWSAQGNHAASAITSTNAQSGSASLQLLATGPGDSTANRVTQARSLSGLASVPVTLSFWYLPDPLVDNLTVELTSSSAAITLPPALPAPATNGVASPGTSNTVAATLPELPALYLNEIMPSNLTAWADNAGQFDPWIELINSGTTTVDLTACRLSNTYTNPALWAFPAGLTLAPQTRLLVWADAQTNQTAGPNLHAAFRLHPATGSVILALAHTNTILVLDSLDYANLGPDVSYGSFPEADPQSRQVFHNPSPGFANTPASFVTRIVINEWMADNAATLRDPTDQKFEDWFELHNPTPQPVNLGGYSLTDALAQTNQFIIPGGTIIPAGGFALVWADGNPEANAPGTDLHTNFKLSKEGEAIALYKPDGTLLDAVAFGPQTTDRSEGAWPDGNAALYPMAPPTPNAPNRVLLVNSLTDAPAGALTLTWGAESGRLYDVLGATNLIATNWLPLATITATATSVSYTDTNAPAFPHRFYRLTLPE